MDEYTHDTVGRFIELRGDGRRLLAECPFHHEETGSLVIDQDKHIYHCFGCSAHGHLSDFEVEFKRARSFSERH